MNANTSMVRRRAESCLLTLPMACYHAVHDHPGGVGAVAGAYGRNAGTLQNKLNPNVQSHVLSVADLEEIARLTKDERILQTVCSWFGAGYWIMPQGVLGDGSLFEQSAELAKEVGELMSEVTQALADGKVTPMEVQALDKAVMELAAAAKALVEQAKVVGGCEG